MRNSSAFTVTELVVVLAGCALLMISALPLLGNSRLRSERLVCGNNLRQIGVAFQTWSDSFEDNVPWRVQSSNGGSAGPLMDNAWYNFLVISNELANPALLGCPSDNVRLARTWTATADGGFVNPAYRNNALSYLVGCHSEIRLPSSILSADRTMTPDSRGAACSLGFQNAIGINSGPSTSVAWNAASNHVGTGNVLLSGGNVLELSTLGLRQFFFDPNADNGSQHFVVPR